MMSLDTLNNAISVDYISEKQIDIYQKSYSRK